MYQGKPRFQATLHNHACVCTCTYIHACIYNVMHSVVCCNIRGFVNEIFPLFPQHWGMTRLTTNSTTLVFEFIHDDDGMVHDSLVLRK